MYFGLRPPRPQFRWYLTLNISPTVTTQGVPDSTLSLCLSLAGLKFNQTGHTAFCLWTLEWR